MSNSHTKFDWTLSNGLGGDRVTDGQKDGRANGQMEAIAISQKLFLRRVGIIILAFQS